MPHGSCPDVPAAAAAAAAAAVVDVFAGVDVAEDALAACVLRADSRSDVAAATYDDAGLAALVDQFKAAGVTLVCCEATGGLERPLVAACAAARIPIAVVDPRRVRQFARSLGRRAKTDPVDAAVIARFALVARPAPKAAATAARLRLDQLAARRAQLVRTRAAELCRRRRCDLAEVRATIDAMIEAIDAQVEAVDALIAKEVAADARMTEVADVLDTCPGVGPTTARQLVAQFPELGTLGPKQAAALAGVAPYNDDSGKHQGKRRVAGGRPAVRCALFLAAMAAVRFNAVIKSFYERLRGRGTPKMVALTACMRKLVVILNAMARDRAAWDPRTAAATCQSP